jgi:uncharacterized DUF497 family protein
MQLTFEWDPRKAEANRTKHRVTFEEAITAFGDPLGRLETDPRHSVDEERLVLLGRSAAGRLLAVMFTDRGASRLRVISARLATRRERTIYEEASE